MQVTRVSVTQDGKVQSQVILLSWLTNQTKYKSSHCGTISLNEVAVGIIFSYNGNTKGSIPYPIGSYKNSLDFEHPDEHENTESRLGARIHKQFVDQIPPPSIMT